MSARYDAVLFDLFSALLDSSAVWSDVAGDADLGAGWREEASRVAYSTGAYRPFVETVAQAARVVGVPPERAPELLRGMSEQLEPWPEAPELSDPPGQEDEEEKEEKQAAAAAEVEAEEVAEAEEAHVADSNDVPADSPAPEVDDRPMMFCSPEHEQLYHDYWLPRYGQHSYRAKEVSQ